MRSFRRGVRGLAEIVGTLMLVVIVVAAATAFSFFVTDYEKQVLAQEAHNHLVSAEKIRVTGITLEAPTHVAPWSLLNGPYVNVSLVSADPNSMFLTDYELNGAFSQNWVFDNSTPPLTACSVAGAPTAPSTCTELTAFAGARVALPFSGSTGPIELDVETSLGNVFVFVFFAPAPILKTTVLPEATYSEPLFDGSGSYQPSGGDNASIVLYTWTIEDLNTTTCVVGGGPECAAGPAEYSAPQIEVSQLSSEATSHTFQVNLTVTNSDGLSATTSVFYEA